ncbi:hypothetical protein M9H77_31667 [Catharanthus roseus]|uniref:Uncharacterized protein n=1 Tax=Catharanthus roseus TaxID=4058 RepID=A0ACC0A1R9_CATRO|nr:hypothetical protein M9H77_31667 [Catharanthus roseus]
MKFYSHTLYLFLICFLPFCNSGGIKEPKTLLLFWYKILYCASDDELSPVYGDVRFDSSDNENQGANSDKEQLEEQTSKGIATKRKRYHRHTNHQIQQMELFFKQCPRPNEKQRKELGLELGLDPLQVKFWFQNKRTQMKNKWLRVFSGMISKGMLNQVISKGAAESYNGALQVISVELCALSLVIPTRKYDFLRYCKKLNDETWVVVDVSVDPLLFQSPLNQCRRRPSRCIIQAMPNSCSKITWVEHMEVPDQIIHSLSRSIISSGNAYGAKRWVSFMKRQCERLTCATDIMNYPYVQDLNKIALANLEGKQNILKLAERMVLNFYGGVSSSSSAYNWTVVVGNGIDEVRIMTRKTIDDPGRPGGMVLCASICFWIPILPEIVFDYLRNENIRPEWDILSNGGVVQTIAQIGNGQESGNSITLLQVTNVDSNQEDILILQESSAEPTTSYVIYTPMDVARINGLFGGVGDPETVKLLSSGFSILPMTARI